MACARKWGFYFPSAGKPLLEVGDTDGGWVKLNAGQLAPLRVQYPPRLWSRLAAAAADGSQLQQVPLIHLASAHRITIVYL